jgi:hypothetical protein
VQAESQIPNIEQGIMKEERKTRAEYLKKELRAFGA